MEAVFENVASLSGGASQKEFDKVSHKVAALIRSFPVKATKENLASALIRRAQVEGLGSSW